MQADPDHLTRMLTRLKLTAVRDQLESLLDEAARGELLIRDSLSLLCEREIARKDSRRIEMAMGLARFPFARDLAGFDFAAQPSIDRGQVRDLASGRFVANGETVLLLEPTESDSYCSRCYASTMQGRSGRDIQTAVFELGDHQQRA